MKKDPYKQSVQENEIDICEEILTDVDNILNEFPDVPEINFPADTSHFDFDPNPINRSIFPVDTSVQPDLNPNPINQGPADDFIGTPSINLPLRESATVLENGPKKKRARTQVAKSERNAKKNTLFCHCIKYYQLFP